MKRIVSCILAFWIVVGCVPANAFQVYATKTETDYTVSETSVVADPDFSDGDELLDGYIYQLFYGNAVTYRRKAGDLLTGNEKRVYDALVPFIEEIAAGERSSTVIAFGHPFEGNPVDVEISFESTGLDLYIVIDALLIDLSYELYWYDKTKGTGFSGISSNVLEYGRISFSVSENYRGTEEFTVDCRQAREAVVAAGKSAAIISKYADSTDYEKLLGYKDEICDLVEYDYDAADYGDFSVDNDPWQLIHVFDGKENTNVVCEGYSKAFAYLCEQTVFAGDVSCITAMGYMTYGEHLPDYGDLVPVGHMWNIVTLEGNNYLVDVTNSESGTVGYDGSLFLAGGVGSIAEDFQIGDCYYQYYEKVVAFWGDGPDSILNLAPERYVPVAAQVVASGNCNEQIRWSLDAAGTLTLTGTGDVPDYPLYGAPWYAEHKDSIKTVIVEESIEFIGSYVFAALPNLSRVTLSDTVVSIGVGIFQDCTSLTDVSLPWSLSTIQEFAFAGCTALEEIKLPLLVLGIGDAAFYGCTALRKVNIPFQVHEISSSTFDRCESLEQFQLPSNSRYFSTDDTGALYSKDGTVLYKVPGKAVSGHYVIPDAVTTIGEAALADCTGMTVVTVSKAVTEIGENAFGRCGDLTEVYYTGTAAQWQQITIAQGNASLIDAQLHFVVCSNHQMVQYPAKAPSCTESGWNTYAICENCGHSNYQETPATGHIFFPYAGKEPTCTEYGWNAYGICEKCDYTSYQEIPALGHSFVQYEAKTPTCTEYGWNAYGICQVCDYSTYEEIPAPGHRYEDVICTVCGGEAEILESGSCGAQVFWEMRDGGILLISGSGDMEDYDGKYATPWADHILDIKVVLIREGVTTIGDSAFSECQALTEVDFASTVTRIGNYTFFGCAGLTEIVFGAGVSQIGNYAFCECDGLTDVVIGDSITEIGYHSFTHCSSLKTVTIGSRVVAIRDGAFDDCPMLLEYRVSSDNRSYSSDEHGVLFNKNKTVLLRVPCGISGSYAIPSGVTTIEEGAFSGCHGLTGVTVPETLTVLHKSAFEDCSNLRYNLHNDVQYLGSMDNPYYILMKPNGDAVTQLQIHPDTKMIAEEAFYDCQTLTAVTIPDSVTSVGSHAFGNCTGLVSLTIENGLQVIGEYAFSRCSALTELTIPDSVTAIGKNAFGSCTGLTSVKMGKGVKTIGEYAFILCTGLSNITIGEGVSTIGNYAFFYCTDLSSVTIPVSVVEICEHAFDSCGKLQDVYYWGSEQQWTKVDIKKNNSWKDTVNLHFYSGHDHSYEDFICTLCGHKAVDLSITEVTLRPDCTGLYYTGSFRVEEGVEIVRKGIAVSVFSQLPVADSTDPHSRWTEDSTSVLVFNILNADNNPASNASRAEIAVYARAYVELKDGTYIYSDVIAMNLRQVVEAADAQWETLDEAQKTSFTAMYAKYQTVMNGWDIPNLKRN